MPAAIAAPSSPPVTFNCKNAERPVSLALERGSAAFAVRVLVNGSKPRLQAGFRGIQIKTDCVELYTRVKGRTQILCESLINIFCVSFDLGPAGSCAGLGRPRRGGFCRQQ